MILPVVTVRALHAPQQDPPDKNIVLPGLSERSSVGADREPAADDEGHPQRVVVHQKLVELLSTDGRKILHRHVHSGLVQDGLRDNPSGSRRRRRTRGSGGHLLVLAMVRKVGDSRNVTSIGLDIGLGLRLGLGVGKSDVRLRRGPSTVGLQVESDAEDSISRWCPVPSGWDVNTNVIISIAEVATGSVADQMG